VGGAVVVVQRLRLRPPQPSDFSSTLRSPAVAARIGVWLGTCFLIAFLTGLYSHVSQVATPWFAAPTRPIWLYRVTQGLHVISGTAAVPLLLVKLWTVYPRLFAKIARRDARALILLAFERGSIGVLVTGAIFQLVTGLANSAQWYPWGFAFPATHYAVAWLVIGALLTHIAVKLPVIRIAFLHDVDEVEEAEEGSDANSPPRVHPKGQPVAAGAPASAGAQATAGGRASAGSHAVGRSAPLSRRGLLRATWLATGVAVLTTAGATLPALRKVSVFGVRSGDGPQGVPINKSAVAAGVVKDAMAPGYRLTLSAGKQKRQFSRADLEALPQVSVTLPIACVEGWSASGTWTGVRVADLVAAVSPGRSADVIVTSLQKTGPYITTMLPANFVADPDTLLALKLNGETLTVDHGYPCRIIAPNRPGVLQTKWVSELAVQA